MAKPDKVFQQAYSWFKGSIERGLAASPLSAAEQSEVESLIWQMLGLLNPAAPPAEPNIEHFRDSGVTGQSLSHASQVIAESLVALDVLKDAVAALKPGGNPASALALVSPVIHQIERLAHPQPNSHLPSAFSVAKMLLMLSGDAQANGGAGQEAAKLAALVGAGTPQDVENVQTALALISLVIGSAMDRSFAAPASAPTSGWGPSQVLPVFVGKPVWTLPAPAGLGATLEFDIGASNAIKAALDLQVNRSAPLDGNSFQIDMSAKAG
ncbi:MAG: hypothetical protein ABI478_14480, partial [Propionivibrio sp.]